MSDVRIHRSRQPAAVATALLLLLLAGCGDPQHPDDQHPDDQHPADQRRGQPQRAPQQAQQPTPAVAGGGSSGISPAPGELFVERAAELGIDFVHFNGMSGDLYLLETMGSGAALFDYDNDGDLDLYLVQGAMLGEGKTPADATFPPVGGAGELIDRLYRNDLSSGGELSFTDVTRSSGIVADGYGMGVAAGDYDNDGWTDLLVTNWGETQLWHNQGDGRFSDQAAAAGVTSGHQWSASAAFVDYDHDGWLDLYITTYVEFRYPLHVVCESPTNMPDYCGPLAFEARSDRLLHNRRDGTFRDVSVEAGISGERANGLGVATADLDGNGWIDIYVANDSMANQLWLNQGDGTFVNGALLAGCAVNRNGMPEASMGVDAGDLDGDGDDDLYVSHMTRESNTLYLNLGEGLFDERTSEAGLASWSYSTYGTAWFDYDNDSWLDLLLNNGAMIIIESQAQAGLPYPLLQPNQLFRNRGDGTFEDVSERSGVCFQVEEVGRGAAFGDLDNDGDTDVALSLSAGPARLLLNQVGGSERWLGLRLVGASGRDMLGARVQVELADGGELWRRVRSDGSFCSANDPRVLVGLGDRRVNAVRVHWLEGGVEQWTDLAAGRYHTLQQGDGHTVGGQ